MCALKVLKFGGTSVATFESILSCANIVKSERDVHVVVVSAQAIITEKLLSLADSTSLEHLNFIINDIALFYDNFTLPMYGLPLQSLCRTLIDEWLNQLNLLALRYFQSQERGDYHALISMGEIVSSQLVSAIFENCNLDNTLVSATELVSVKGVGNERQQIDRPACQTACANQLSDLPPSRLIVTQGFIANQAETGQLVTLGRGGSDLSAAIIAEAANASELQIWTDVEGVLSGDPRVLKHARPLAEVSYHTASLLAKLGAKVLHKKSIAPAMRKSIPIVVGSTFKPEMNRTLIHNVTEPTGALSVTYLKDVCILTLSQGDITDSNLLQIVLKTLAQLGTDYLAFELHADRMTIVLQTVEVKVLEALDQALLSNGFEDILVESEYHMAFVSLVGTQLNRAPYIRAYTQALLEHHEVKHSFSTGNDCVVSYVVDMTQLVSVLQTLHAQVIGSHQSIELDH